MINDNSGQFSMAYLTDRDEHMHTALYKTFI